MKKNQIYFLTLFAISILGISCQKVNLQPEVALKNVQDSKTKNAKLELTENQLLVRQYTEWIFGRERSLAPWTDATGDKQYVNQPLASGTMILAGGDDVGIINRTVNIDLNQYQYVFVPLTDIFSWYNDCIPGHPVNGQLPYGSISNVPKQGFNGQNNITLKWDGNSILTSKTSDFSVNSDFWSFIIHPSWNGSCELPSTFYVDGFFAKVPLSSGIHTLEIGGELNIPKYKAVFETQVKYTLNVTN